MNNKLVVFYILLVFSVIAKGAKPANVEILYPSPIIEHNNGRRTYEAVRDEEIFFVADFYNAAPIPEQDMQISFLRLLHSEEEPVPKSLTSCDETPCRLNISVTANEFAESKFTFRGFDLSGDPVIDSSFHVTVGGAAVGLKWVCTSPCYRYDESGHLLIAPRTIGYPMPHLWQLYSQQNLLLSNLTVKNVNDQFNLSSADYKPGEVLTLVVSNRLGENISMNIETSGGPLSTYAVTEHTGEMSPTTAWSVQGANVKVIIAVVGGIVAVFAVIIVLVLLRRNIKKACKSCSNHQTQPSSADTSDEESKSLAHADVDHSRKPPEQSVAIHCRVTFEHDQGIAPCVVPGGHAPSLPDSSSPSVYSVESEGAHSLDQDGATVGQPEHNMDELKTSAGVRGHADSTDSSDLEMDGQPYNKPVQESQGSHCSLITDTFSS